MVILLFKLLTKIVFPLLADLIFAFIPLIIVVGLGVLIILRVKIRNLSTKIFQGIECIARKILKILIALVLTILALIPKVYCRIERYCRGKGANSVVSNLISIVVVSLLVAIII